MCKLLIFLVYSNPAEEIYVNAVVFSDVLMRPKGIRPRTGLARPRPCVGKAKALCGKTHAIARALDTKAKARNIGFKDKAVRRNITGWSGNCVSTSDRYWWMRYVFGLSVCECVRPSVRASVLECVRKSVSAPYVTNQ